MPPKDRPRPRPVGPPPADDGAGRTQSPRPDEPSEDFAARRDIETADEPSGEHDRRHHDRNGAGVESPRPA